jgi:GNAT superfamily N-acetyltransferase
MDGVLAELIVPAGPVLLREATREDLPALVALFAEDALGTGKDDAGAELGPYLRAFEAMAADPAHLLVAVECAGEVVGTLQLSVLPGLARHGALRGQLEGVHVRADHQGSGIGSATVRWAVEEARRRGCALLQLTSQERRTDAHRFYRRLGFTASHTGFKLLL